jgi:hypothetical protein
MDQHRINGLAMLSSINKNIKVIPEQVLDTFCYKMSTKTSIIVYAKLLSFETSSSSSSSSSS